MRHMMIDLETFATSCDAGIVQGGGLVFDPTTPEGFEYINTAFERAVTLQSSLLLGARYDPGTRDWWNTQTPSARKLICQRAVDVDAFLDLVDECWRYGESTAVWSHGASFDIPILEFHYTALGRKTPWKYSAVRDTRTLFWMATAAGWQKPNRITAHGGLADARDQASDVVGAVAHLNAKLGDDGWLSALDI